jgi:putative ABC transport system permease protein
MSSEPKKPSGWRRLLPNAKRDVEDELSFHLEMRIRELIDRGIDPEEARRMTLERFGDVNEPRKEMLSITERRTRRMARSEFTDELRQDIGYALRALRRSPGFTFIAVLTIALGIGANSAIFSVVHGVLLESLPFADPARLVQVQTAYPNGENYSLSAPDFMSVHDHNRSFTDVVAYSTQAPTLLGLGEPREIDGAVVSKDYFSVLGVRPAIGRLFDENDHVPGRANVLVLSYGFWQQQMGADRSALGKSLNLAGRPYTVIGVLENGAQFPASAQLFSPIAYDSSFNSTTSFTRRGEWLDVIGRLRPNTDLEASLGDARRIGTELQTQFRQTNDKLTFTTRSLMESLVGEVRMPLLVLMGAVGFVLLVACANVANLLLARATARESELAVRAALGAGRGRLIRQLLTESTVLAGLGAVLGLLLAWWSTRALVTARPVELPRLDQIGVDRTVVFFTAGIALFTGVLFGVLPALQATGTRLSQSLREGGRGALSGIHGRRVRSGLVVVEMALAVMLLVGAGLLIRSFLQLTSVNPGFEPERAVAFRLSLQGAAYREPTSRVQFFARLTDQLEALPGVTAVGAVSGLPTTGRAGMWNFAVQGAPPPPAGIFPEIRAQIVTPEYFGALGGKLLRGRMLNQQDNASAPPVALVNRAAIARWFPDGDPIGERIVTDLTREVVGVVENVLQRSPSDPIEPEIYVPHAQQPARTLRFIVRTTGDAALLAPRIRQEVRSLDAQLPLEDITPLTEIVATAVARPRFYTTLLAIFAGLALLLAVIGIFGVMSYIVAQRKREISVRMALGANAGQVLKMVVGGGLGLAALGLAFGLVGSLALGRVLQSQLYGVRLTDPVTLLGVLLVLMTSAGVASYLPARSAAAVDPGSALRET